MPLYEFRNVVSGLIWEDMMSYSDCKKYLLSHPDVELMIGAPAIISGIAGVTHKTDGGFKDMMSRIADANPGSPLADQYGSKGIKETKVRNIVNKHKNRK